jgi:hypothetical protein
LATSSAAIRTISLVSCNRGRGSEGKFTYSMRPAILLTCVLLGQPLSGADGHSPLLPRPQQIQYGTSRLPMAGLEIGLASDPTAQDRFAADELASGLASRAESLSCTHTKAFLRWSPRLTSRARLRRRFGLSPIGSMRAIGPRACPPARPARESKRTV